MNGVTKRHCLTANCMVWYLAKSNGQKYCEVCARRRKLAQNRRSKVAYDAKSDAELELIDMSPAMVDRIFNAALKDIRQQKLHRVEAASWDYRGRYTEP